MQVGDTCGEVRIRNISTTGAMIEGIEFGRNPKDLPITIELIEGQKFAARIKWAAEGKAGIEFAERFNLEQLNTPAEPGRLRQAG